MTLLSLRYRITVAGCILMTLLLIAGVTMPGSRPLLTQIIIFAIFALSYDLLEGFGGIVSLGHAAYFGVGAYSAALLAGLGFASPILAVVISGAVAACTALILTPVIVRGTDFTRLLVTLGVGLMLFETANQLREITGGADGLSGYDPGKILGFFAFDIFGLTGFYYSLIILAVVYVALRRIVTSPFGLSLAGLRECMRRMPAIGASVGKQLAITYTLSGFVAGVAGAVLAQTSQIVSLDVLGFEKSAEVAMIVAIGGLGSLYGAILGAIAFVGLKDHLSTLSPQYWHLSLGIALVALVLFARGGLSNTLDRILSNLRKQRVP